MWPKPNHLIIKITELGIQLLAHMEQIFLRDKNTPHSEPPYDNCDGLSRHCRLSPRLPTSLCHVC